MEDNVQQVVVVTAPGRVSRVTFNKVKAQVEEAFPDRKLIVLEEGMTLDVVYVS